MSRRTGIRTNRVDEEASTGAGTTSFPYIKGNKIICTSERLGEVITGKFSRRTKDGNKIAVVVNKRERWILLTDYVIERDIA